MHAEHKERCKNMEDMTDLVSPTNIAKKGMYKLYHLQHNHCNLELHMTQHTLCVVISDWQRLFAAVAAVRCTTLKQYLACVYSPAEVLMMTYLYISLSSFFCHSNCNQMLQCILKYTIRSFIYRGGWEKAESILCVCVCARIHTHKRDMYNGICSVPSRNANRFCCIFV